MGTRPTADAFLKLLGHCPELLLIADLDGGILLRDEAAKRTFGTGTGGAVRLGELVHPQDRAAFDVAWARLAKGPEPVRLQCRLRDAQGHYATFVCSARRAPERNEVIAMLYAIGADAEPARDMEEAPAVRTETQQLHVLERRILRVILENIPFCVWVFDSEGNYMFNDGKGLEAVGGKPGQLVGQNAFKLYPELTSPESNLRKALAGETRHSIREAFGIVWESWYMPVRNDRGEIESVVGATLNITENKRIEKELRAKIEVIETQQAVIRELGTPILEVWDRVLTLPLIGIVDSDRVAGVMESLLGKIVQSGARYAILDLTGVHTVDTATATHVLKLIRAIRLLGAEGVITGIRANVAQAMVTLGLDLSSIATRANLREGLQFCMRRPA